MYFLYIYSTIFMSTLHVSKDLVVHHQDFIIMYCITQLLLLGLSVLTVRAKQLDMFARLYGAVQYNKGKVIPFQT